jgi:hypothetical protein
LTAARAGDFEELIRLLAPDAVVTADATAIQTGTPRRIDGRQAVAGFFNGAASAALPAFVDDRAGAAWFHRGEARVAFDFDVRDGLVYGITFRGDPELLARLTRRRGGQRAE